MTQYSQERTNAREYRDLGSQPGGMFEAAMEDSSGRAAFNALLSGQSGSLPDCLVASPKEFLVKSNHEAQTMQGFHLDILSASTYPDLLSAPDANTRRQGRRHTQPSTFGGYEMLEDIDDSSGHMAHDRPDAEKPAKKRVKRASRSDDDDNIKKQRGRPRLDTRDKTAADVRFETCFANDLADSVTATKDTDTPRPTSVPTKKRNNDNSPEEASKRTRGYD